MVTRPIKRDLIVVLATLLSLCGNAQNSAQIHSRASLKRADSLFAARNWREARKIYETTLQDTAYHHNPPAPLKAAVYSRLAKLSALEGNKPEALANLDSAAASSYFNLRELDSLPDFSSIRDDAHFKKIRQQVFAALYPCMSDPHARQFDFWIGEWDVYQTGTDNYQGHSLIQMIAGGCALLENWDSQNSTGKSINFIDPVTNTWKQTWAGSYTAGIQEFVNGKYEDSAMRFNFQSTDSKGNITIGRFIFYNEGPEQVRQFNETSADGGKTWTTGYDLTYKRKKH